MLPVTFLGARLILKMGFAPEITSGPHGAVLILFMIQGLVTAQPHTPEPEARPRPVPSGIPGSEHASKGNHVQTDHCY